MKFLKKIFLFYLLLFSTLWANESEGANKDLAFDNLFVSLQVGELYPWGNLQDAVENSFYAGAGIRYTYWEDVDGFVQMEYSYFEPSAKHKSIDGVHQVNGKLGLSYHHQMIKSVELGAGFLCTWTRADHDEKKGKIDFKKDLGGTLADNETEFGWFFRLFLPIWKTENYRLSLDAQWQELWTLPERSDMMSFGLVVERRIW